MSVPARPRMAGWGTLGAINNGPRVAHREGAANVAKVTMPQLGESVAEGTIGKWLKQPGDHVDKYEPLVEVVTDKVNAEVPSPFEGILREILAEEGSVVPNNADIAVIETADDAGSGADAPAAPSALRPLPRRDEAPAASEARPTERPAPRRRPPRPTAPAPAAAPAPAPGPAGSDERGPAEMAAAVAAPPGDRRPGRQDDAGGPSPPARTRADRGPDRRYRRRRPDHPRGRPQGRRVDPDRRRGPRAGSRAAGPGVRPGSGQNGSSAPPRPPHPRAAAAAPREDPSARRSSSPKAPTKSSCR